MTPADVFGWLGLVVEVGSPAEESMQRVVDAVTTHIGRIYTPTPATDEDPTPDLSDWNLAHIMAAARLYQRSKSPNGVIDFGEFGSMRVTSLDRDVQNLLAPFAPLGFG